MQAATNIRPSIIQVNLASESIRLQANRKGIRHGVSPNKDKNDSGAVAAQPSLRKARKIQPAGFLHRLLVSIVFSSSGRQCDVRHDWLHVTIKWRKNLHWR